MLFYDFLKGAEMNMNLFQFFKSCGVPPSPFVNILLTYNFGKYKSTFLSKTRIE